MMIGERPKRIMGIRLIKNDRGVDDRNDEKFLSKITQYA